MDTQKENEQTKLIEDKKNINRTTFLNTLIPIPSIQEQEKIIKEIEQIESTQSTYAEYGKMIQSQIESINKVINNLTKLNDNSNNDPGISLGAEFSTSGHAFQVFIANYNGILPQYNNMNDANDFFGKGGILIGFNITRRYSF